MKKVLAVVLCLLMLVSATACSGKKEKEETPADSNLGLYTLTTAEMSGLSNPPVL